MQGCSFMSVSTHALLCSLGSGGVRERGVAHTLPCGEQRQWPGRCASHEQAGWAVDADAGPAPL